MSEIVTRQDFTSIAADYQFRFLFTTPNLILRWEMTGSETAPLVQFNSN
jgi:hypothetical protein